MKNILIIIMLIPIFTVFSQFETRIHLNGGGNMQLTSADYQLYKDFVAGGETIFGFRVSKLFLGVGVGAEYTGTNYLSLKDSVGQEIKKLNVYNVDVPFFLDATYGKKFYLEGKVGYTYKLVNVSEFKDVNLNTLFNSVGIGYSIAIKENMLIDVAVEGKFNYMFSNAVSQNYTSVYFLPIAKVGFRFTKASL